MNLADKRQRRPRSGPLSPALTGLVTFSFALLGMGVVAYASSLPSLVEASQRSDETSLYTVFVDGLLGETGLGMAPEKTGEDAKAEGGPTAEGEDAKNAEGAKKDAAHPGGKITLGGVKLEGVIAGVVQGGQNAEGAAASKPGQGSDSEGKPSQGSGGASGGSSSNSGGTPVAPEPPVAPETPQEPPVSAEEEQRIYNQLLAKVNLINGYVGEVNALTSAFNNDCQAAQGVRQAHRVTANGLGERLLNEYLAVRDQIAIPNESKYKSAQGSLIRMYRLLTEYAYEVRDVWDNNLGPEPGDVNALLARLGASNSRILGEFRSVYEGFTL